MLDRKCLVIIPIYNEEAHVKEVVQEVLKRTCQVLLVNDGSTDGTLEAIKSFTGYHLIDHEKNEGYGKSLIDGFGFSMENNYDFVITMDCDKQHEPSHIVQFFDAVEESDIVSGSRYLPESNASGIATPSDRRDINEIITRRINQITGYGITDAFCGFKAYKVSALRKLRLTEAGYGMPLQLWIQAWRAGLTVKEIPIEKIYLDPGRDFKGQLADSATRLTYYNEVIDAELAAPR
jgi:dolichol-phosphate mannosyltransferase